MGLIETRSPEAARLTGLHLYHAGKSACSARVRLLLEEKGLEWTGHYVDIYTRANVSPEYFAINPKGLVPTLVHDGRVIVESNDILLYLDEAYPQPSFMPDDAAQRVKIEDWLNRCGDLHLPAVKTYAYARMHAKNVVKTKEEVELYRSLQTDKDLLDFHGKHDGDGASGFSDAEVEAAAALLRSTLTELSEGIEAGGWIVGDAYSLADISWAPAILTITGAGFPLDEFPAIEDWYARVAARPAYDRAVLAWRRTERPDLEPQAATA